MNKGLTITGLIALTTLATVLYTLRYSEANTPADAATAAAPLPAMPATPVAPTGPAPSGDTALATPVDAGPAVTAIASEQERAATRDARQQSLPVFLQAAEATLAQVRADIATLKARGAPATEIQAQEARLQQLLRVREQVLARNADIAAPR